MAAPPLGLELVATATRRAGHDVTFLDLLSEPEPLLAVQRVLAASAPAVIGISVRNIDDQDMRTQRFLLEPVKSLVAACRAGSDAPIVLGGAGYSIFPDAALDYLSADLGIEGEGEFAFPALLDRLAQQRDAARVPGVHVAGKGCEVARHFAADLDTSPFPEGTSWLASGTAASDVWVPVQTRRGCGFGCTYCATAGIEGRAVRARSPQSVVAYIERVARAGFAQFYFVDNTFNCPLSYALTLCDGLAALPLDITWRCILYPHGVSQELVAKMAAAGCVEVSLGFESGSSAVLRALNKRFEPEEVRRISDLLAQYGIRRQGFLLLGSPGETRESVEESLAFADSLALDMLKVTVGVRIYPATALAAIAREEGVISATDDLLVPRYYIPPGLEEPMRAVAAQYAT